MSGISIEWEEIESWEGILTCAECAAPTTQGMQRSDLLAPRMRTGRGDNRQKRPGDSTGEGGERTDDSTGKGGEK